MRAFIRSAVVAFGVLTCMGSVSAEAATFTGKYTNAAGTRSFRVYVPSTYSSATPLPLVVALHGCTETADQFRQLTQFDQLAEARKFIVVYPEQSSSANSFRCWNWFLDAHMHRGSGEPSLIAGITGWMEHHYAVDLRRIYATGLSAGGAMASVMGATYPHVYAAIGVGSGCEYAAGAPCAGYRSADPQTAGQLAFRAMGAFARPLPVVVFQGDQDTTVPPVNADQLVEQWQVTADWADDGSANGSVPRSARKTSFVLAAGRRAATLASYPDAHNQELVQRWTVHGMGHAWSGGCSCAQYSDPSGPDESRAMYDFFTAHPHPHPVPLPVEGNSPPSGGQASGGRRRAVVRITSVRRRGKHKVRVSGAVLPRRNTRVTIRVRAHGRTVARKVIRSPRGRWRTTVHVPRRRTFTVRASTRATRKLSSATATRRVHRTTKKRR